MKRGFSLPLFFLIPVFLIFPLVNLDAQTLEIRGEQERALPFNGTVEDIAYSPFGSYFAVCFRDNRIRLYSSSLRTLWNQSGPHHYAKGTSTIAFTHDEEYLIFPKYRSPEDIALLDLNTLEVTHILRGHAQEIRALGLSENSRYMVSSSRADDLVLWERDGHEYKKISSAGGLEGRIGRIVFHPDGNLFACSNHDDTISLWKIENGTLKAKGILKPEQHFGNTGYLYGMAFSPNGEFLAAGLRDEITIWKRNGDSWNVFQVISGISEGYIQALEFTPESSSFACSFARGIIRFYSFNGSSWVPGDILDARQDYVEDLAIHPSGRTIAAGSSWDSALVLWKIEGLPPGPQRKIQEALGGRTGRAQKKVLTRTRAEEIISKIDPFMFEEQDEFETSEEYAERKRELKGMLLKDFQMELEKYYGIISDESAPGFRKITIPLQDLGSYDIETEIYSLWMMDTPGSITIPRNEARSLKRNIDGTVITGESEINADGISSVYRNFNLIHPQNGSRYQVTLSENPFHSKTLSPETEDFREIEAGPYLVVQGINLEPVFPGLYRYYALKPVGNIELFNTGSVPVENITISLSMDRYMDSKGVSGGAAPSIDLPAGESTEAGVFALFNEEVLSISEGDTVSSELTVSYTARGEKYESVIPRTLQFLGRNAVSWDDDKKIAAFMTAKDPVILKYAKQASGISGEIRARGLDRNMMTAMKVFEALGALPMNYTIDPSSPYSELSISSGGVDFIQFPGQSLDFKAGDCDDLSILYNTLLESLGIPTAFITIPGHIFTAFQLRMTPREAEKVFAGGRDFILQKDKVWIPVETTLIGKGFSSARKAGFRQWAENGSKAGFFSTAESWSIYEPVNFTADREIFFPAESRVTGNFLKEVDKFAEGEIREHKEQLAVRFEGNEMDPKYLNSLGLIYSRFGFYDKALDFFDEVISQDDYLPAIMNAGNVCAFQGNMDKAVRYYLEAANKAPENPRILLSLGKAYLKLGDYSNAEEAVGRARRIDPGIPAGLLNQETGSASRASEAEDLTEDPDFAGWE